jgi:hypothetical protein
MQHLNNIIETLKDGLPEVVITFDDRVLAALAKQPAVQWCAENATTLRPEMKQALAAIYQQAAYRGGTGAGEKARAAFLRIQPDDEKLFDRAGPIDFTLDYLVACGLPEAVVPKAGRVSLYFTAVRHALRELFPDGCRPSLGTAMNLLRAVPDVLDGELRLNEMTGEVVVGDRDLSDADVSTFRANIERRFISMKGEPLAIGKDAAWDAVLAVAPDRTFHPIRDYLDALTWDGTARLERVAVEMLNSGHDLPLVRRFVRLWFIGCVARIYQPGCKMDNMLVLVSDQGFVKSTFFATLAGPRYFTDTTINFENKDSLMVMRRAWIAEHAEMKALMAAKSEEEIKAGITRTVDEFRPPYGRASVRVPRHTVFAGTTNNGEFLRDPTGNRRYWPVLVSDRIDIEKVSAWRDQLWAEAVVAYRNKEQWWLAPDDEAALREYQEQFTRIDCWENAISGYLATQKSVTLNDVLRAVGVSIEHQDPRAETRAKAILERLGWVRGRVWLEDGSRPVRYVKKPTKVATDAAGLTAAAA